MKSWRHSSALVLGLALGSLWCAPAALAQQDDPSAAERGRPPERRAPQQPPPAPAQEAEPRRGRVPMDLQTTVIPLKYTNAHETAGILQKSMQGTGTYLQIVADARTNALIVQAENAKVLEKVREVLTQLDVATTPPPAETPIFFQAVPLKNARSGKVKDYLRTLTQMRNQRIVVDADEAANTIWIGGDPAQGPALVKIAQSIDSGAATPAASVAELRTFALKNAQPHRVGSTLGQLMRVMGLEVAIVADDSSGMLIAYATPEESKKLEHLIGLLDVPAKFPPAEEKRGVKEKSEKN